MTECHKKSRHYDPSLGTSGSSSGWSHVLRYLDFCTLARSKSVSRSMEREVNHYLERMEKVVLRVSETTSFTVKECILHMVTSRTGQLQEVEFSLYPSTQEEDSILYTYTTHLLRSNARSLRRIFYQWWQWSPSYPQMNMAHVHLWSQCPLLESVQWTESTLSPTPSSTDFIPWIPETEKENVKKWSQGMLTLAKQCPLLKEIKITHMSPTEMRHFFLQCRSSLTHLQMEQVSLENSSVLPLSHPCCTSLRHLEMSLVSGQDDITLLPESYMDHVVQVAHFQSLVTLRLEWIPTTTITLPCLSLDTVTWSLPHLTELSLRHMTCPILVCPALLSLDWRGNISTITTTTTTATATPFLLWSILLRDTPRLQKMELDYETPVFTPLGEDFVACVPDLRSFCMRGRALTARAIATMVKRSSFSHWTKFSVSYLLHEQTALEKIHLLDHVLSSAPLLHTLSFSPCSPLENGIDTTYSTSSLFSFLSSRHGTDELILSSPPTHTSLRHLEWKLGGRPTSDVFTRWKCPSLEILRTDPDMEIPHLLSFISSCSSTLEELSTACRFEPRPLLRLPSLVFLFIKGDPTHVEVVDTLLKSVNFNVLTVIEVTSVTLRTLHHFLHSLLQSLILCQSSLEDKSSVTETTPVVLDALVLELAPGSSWMHFECLAVEAVLIRLVRLRHLILRGDGADEFQHSLRDSSVHTALPQLTIV